MELRDVRVKEDFDILYREKGIVTTEEKIAFLRNALDIVAEHSVEEFRPEEELSTLQQYVLYGWRRG